MAHWEKRIGGIEESVKKMSTILLNLLQNNNNKKTFLKSTKSPHSENVKNLGGDDDSEKRSMIKSVIQKYKKVLENGNS